MTYSFSVILDPSTVYDDAFVDALYTVGCDDGIISSSGRVLSIFFNREANSRSEAVASAIEQINRLGPLVIGTDYEE